MSSRLLPVVARFVPPPPGVETAPARVCALGLVCMVIASLLAWRLTGDPAAPVALTIGATGAALATRAVVHRLCVRLQASEARCAELEHALHHAQPAQAIGLMTAGIAHDFNNQLTVISSNIELAARSLDRVEDPVAQRLEAAMQGVRRAAGLSTRLLAFRTNAAEQAEAIDVDHIVLGMADLLRRMLGGRIGLQVSPAAPSWLVWTDVRQFETAILALVAHAQECLHEGDCLTIAVSNVAEPHPQAPESLGMLNFVQVSVHVPADAPPLSLPPAELSSVRGFARYAGGFLREIEGAFQLVLPRHRMPPTSRPIGAGRPTILVVEDDAPVRATCVGCLRQHGYLVLEAPDAMEAFRLIADQGGIDLLLIDLCLPGGVSGTMLANAARHTDPGISVLFMTGSRDPGSLDPNGAALLAKPFDTSRLLGAVRQFLGDAAERAQPRSAGNG